MAEAITRIEETQRRCAHTWNPTIPNGFADGSPAHVCASCGHAETVTHYQAANRHYTLNGLPVRADKLFQ